MCFKRSPRAERSASFPRHFVAAIEIAHSPALLIARGLTSRERAILGGLGWLGLRGCDAGSGRSDQRKYGDDGCNSKHENPLYQYRPTLTGPSTMTALWRSQGKSVNQNDFNVLSRSLGVEVAEA
jgi:hypothetical protein